MFLLEPNSCVSQVLTWRGTGWVWWGSAESRRRRRATPRCTSGAGRGACTESGARWGKAAGGGWCPRAPGAPRRGEPGCSSGQGAAAEVWRRRARPAGAPRARATCTAGWRAGRPGGSSLLAGGWGCPGARRRRGWPPWLRGKAAAAAASAAPSSRSAPAAPSRSAGPGDTKTGQGLEIPGAKRVGKNGGKCTKTSQLKIGRSIGTGIVKCFDRTKKMR